MAVAVDQTPGRRRRSEQKRARILDAAEELFVSAGYEQATVDGVAARAQVSKRTIYDHFGDKATLFAAVLERARLAVTWTIRKAIDEELLEGRETRAALIAFAERISLRAFPSPAYFTFRRLLAQPSAPRPAPREYEEPERMLADRLARFAAAGKLSCPQPRIAAAHFAALTVRLVLDAHACDPAGVPESAMHRIVEDGVDAFLRAYR
ncbi:MAG TPA: TetR/AcrR family transcriptional regulator [Mycobacteriales bacterium]|nr:TetR/AcrR family transcriptional regulator [Mycobacteriales bacterium]